MKITTNYYARYDFFIAMENVKREKYVHIAEEEKILNGFMHYNYGIHSCQSECVK